VNRSLSRISDHKSPDIISKKETTPFITQAKDGSDESETKDEPINDSFASPKAKIDDSYSAIGTSIKNEINEEPFILEESPQLKSDYS
jgi:hypothetical protein